MESVLDTEEDRQAGAEDDKDTRCQLAGATVRLCQYSAMVC